MELLGADQKIRPMKTLMNMGNQDDLIEPLLGVKNINSDNLYNRNIKSRGSLQVQRRKSCRHLLQGQSLKKRNPLLSKGSLTGFLLHRSTHEHFQYKKRHTRLAIVISIWTQLYIVEPHKDPDNQSDEENQEQKSLSSQYSSDSTEDEAANAQ